MEFMTECTTIDKPFMIYDADFNKSTDRSETEGGTDREIGVSKGNGENICFEFSHNKK